MTDLEKLANMVEHTDGGEYIDGKYDLEQWIRGAVEKLIENGTSPEGAFEVLDETQFGGELSEHGVYCNIVYDDDNEDEVKEVVIGVEYVNEDIDRDEEECDNSSCDDFEFEDPDEEEDYYEDMIEDYVSQL